MQKKKSIPLILALVTALASGSYAISLDFSNTLNQVISGDTTISGDTFIGSLIDEEKVAEAGLDIICKLDNVPTGYEATCDEWNKNN